MKVTLISSPNNAHSLIQDSRLNYQLHMVEFIFEIECPDLRLFHKFMEDRASAYRQDTTHQHCGEVSYNAPKEIALCEEQARLYYDAIADASCSYQMLLEAGANPFEAASVLPAGSLARATAKFSLHALSHYAQHYGASGQDPHGQQLFSALRGAILFQHPWAHNFLQ